MRRQAGQENESYAEAQARNRLELNIACIACSDKEIERQLDYATAKFAYGNGGGLTALCLRSWI